MSFLDDLLAGINSFGTNLVSDQGFAHDVASFPSTVWQDLYGTTAGTADLLDRIMSGTTAPSDALSEVGQGLKYSVTHPSETISEHPLTTALMLSGGVEGLRALRGSPTLSRLLSEQRGGTAPDMWEGEQAFAPPAEGPVSPVEEMWNKALESPDDPMSQQIIRGVLERSSAGAEQGATLGTLGDRGPRLISDYASGNRQFAPTMPETVAQRIEAMDNARMQAEALMRGDREGGVGRSSSLANPYTDRSNYVRGEGYLGRVGSNDIIEPGVVKEAQLPGYEGRPPTTGRVPQSLADMVAQVRERGVGPRARPPIPRDTPFGQRLNNTINPDVNNLENAMESMRPDTLLTDAQGRTVLGADGKPIRVPGGLSGYSSDIMRPYVKPELEEVVSQTLRNILEKAQDPIERVDMRDLDVPVPHVKNMPDLPYRRLPTSAEESTNPFRSPTDVYHPEFERMASPRSYEGPPPERILPQRATLERLADELARQGTSLNDELGAGWVPHKYTPKSTLEEFMRNKLGYQQGIEGMMGPR